MPYCIPTDPIPCFQYLGNNRDELNAILLTNGGREARFDEQGKADIVTVVKNEDRFIYCKPGSWLRVLGPAQFTAVADKLFKQHYRIVEIAQPVTAAQPDGNSERRV